MAIAVLAVTLLGILALVAISRGRQPQGLSSDPMDAVIAEADSGFLSLADGAIMRFRIQSDDSVELQEVVANAGWLRGIALDDSSLYVADLGPMPCTSLPCKGEQIADSAGEGEAAILAASNGRVIAYPLSDQGGLGEMRVVTSGLPIVNSIHGLNDLEVGPDGSLYLAIGNIEQLFYDPAPFDHPRLDLIGTVTRIDPETGNAEPFARGFRNVFGLAFEGERLWTVDNDGLAGSGWRFEELIEVRQDHNYGYPDEGTFGPHVVRDGFPVWIMPGVGSAGITVVDDGLLVGSCGRIDRVEVRDRQRTQVSLQAGDLPGCVTIVEPLSDNRLLVGIAGPEPELRVLHLDD